MSRVNRRTLLRAAGLLPVAACASPTAATAGPARVPSDVLPLRNWWLTLPTGEPDAEIVKDLTGYTADPWFVGVDGGVRFRANVGGSTTSGSRYPRCELRELDADRKQASWSFRSGTHELATTLAVTATPERKPEVCFAQIHGTSGDLLIVYYDGRAGGIRWKLESKSQAKVLDYSPGTPLDVLVRVADGRGEVLLDGEPLIDFTADSDTCYFKAGAYVLSNPDAGDDPDAYGETVVSALKVTHT